MTKVLKLEAIYNGAYAQLHEYMIVPAEASGILFEKLPIDEIVEDAIDLDELEGKHSQCYGDLLVTEIETDELDPIELKEFIENQNVGYFEIFSETIESKFADKEDFDKEKVENLLKEYDIDKSYIHTISISKNLCKMLKEKQPKLTALNIETAELEKAMKVLEEAGVKVYSKTTL